MAPKLYHYINKLKEKTNIFKKLQQTLKDEFNSNNIGLYILIGSIQSESK